MTRRVLIYVQHLLGTGHLRRAAVVARACAQHGLEVTLASGGVPVDDLDVGGATLAQLPPLKSRDAAFTGLVDAGGRAVDEAWLADRRDRLLKLFNAAAPDVLVVEMFPFGRRQMRFELLPLLDAAHLATPRPRIVSSVRDILTARAPKRSAEAAAWARRYLDAVLVHGDPAVARFDDSFPAAGEIAERITYTGYVAAAAGRRGGPGDAGWDEVVVSAGGGAVGAALMAAAIEARALSRGAADKRWRLLAGANLPAADIARLAARAPDGVVVEPARRDFADLLANCAVSISQAGYNTVVDLMQARARTILVPFARGGQTEQALRAARLAVLGLARVVDEHDLTAAGLAAAVDAALTAPRPGSGAIAIDGAARSAALIAEWAE
jgi:predicted glycosyltransferase